MPVVIDSFEVLPAKESASGDASSTGKESKSPEPSSENFERLLQYLAERDARVRAH